MKDYADVLNLLPEGYEPSLVNGLQFFINQVEKLEEVGVFTMNSYPYCVIGTVFGNMNWGRYDHVILKDFFGIEFSDEVKSNCIIKTYCFTHHSQYMYSAIEWMVVRLFTTQIPMFLNERAMVKVNDWLVIAKDTLNDLKNGVVTHDAL